MSVHAVIAVRGGPEAKSRCAPVLSGQQREALVVNMIEDMLAALADVQAVDHIYIVTPTTAIAERASLLGAIPLVEPHANGLNAALDVARCHIADRDPDARLLLLPGDLPLLDSAELSDFIAAFQPDQCVFVATDDGGTGALLLPVQSKFEFCFGPDSAARHREAAVTAGLGAIAVSAPSLAFDVDTSDDINVVCRCAGDSHTGRYLLSLGVAEECAAR